MDLKYILYIILINLCNLFYFPVLNSQDTVAIPSITITEQKYQRFQANIKLVDSVSITNNLNYSLSDLVLKNTSLYSRTYGPGLIASYGIRGSNSSETIVRWNDFTVNNIMLASADVSLLSATENSKIFIGKNDFETGGIGGSISVNSDISKKANKMYASFNYNTLRNLSIAGYAGFSKKHFANSISAIIENNQNKYYFKRGNEKIQISNSQGEKITLDYNALYHKGNYSIKLFALAYKIDRHIPPSRYESTSDSKQLDEGIKSGFHFKLVKNDFVFKFRTGWFVDRLQYQYPLKNIYSDSYIYSLQSGVKLYWNLGNNWLAKFNVNNENGKVNTDIYGKKQENRLYLSGKLTGTILEKIVIKSGVKTVFYDERIIPLSPFFQLNYIFNKNIRFYFDAGKNFRLPGFNDRYWPDAGVPDLKPESSIFLDMSGYFAITGLLKANASVYYKNISNMIMWRPENGIWRPANIDKVNSKGFDMDIFYKLSLDKLRAEFILSYSFNKSVDRRHPGLNLIYSPENIFVMQQRMIYKKWYLAISQRFTDKVYVTYDNTGTISSYFIIDIKMAKDFEIKKNKFKYIMEINNVFDADYETIKNYPMPGRYLSLGLKYIVNK